MPSTPRTANGSMGSEGSVGDCAPILPILPYSPSVLPWRTWRLGGSATFRQFAIQLRPPAADHLHLPLAPLDNDSLVACQLQVEIGIEDRFLIRAGLAENLSGRRDDLAAADEPAAALNADAVRRQYVDPVLPC